MTNQRDLDNRLTDRDAAIFVAELNDANHGLPVGRAAGVDALRAQLNIPREPDTADVASYDDVIPLTDRSIDVRVYRPSIFHGGCVLFFHGGG